VAPVEPVGRDPGDRGQHHQRQELRKAQQAELERGLLDAHAVMAARDVVELVADDHDHSVGRQHRAEARGPEPAEILDLERGGRGRRSHAAAVAGEARRAKSAMVEGSDANVERC